MVVEEFVEKELFTEVSRLPEPEFIDRYAGILGLRDNVGLARSYRPHFTVLTASPDTYESRVAVTEIYREALRRVGAEEQADRMAEAEPPQEPMTDDEIGDIADMIREIRGRQEAYSQLGPLRKVGHNVLTLLGQGSLAVTEEEARLANLPDVIVHIQQGTGNRQIIINDDRVNVTADALNLY